MSDVTSRDSASQVVYGSGDVAKLIDIQESTLRKYCLILQEHGYEFLKNEHGHRAFFDADIIALRKFITFKNDADMTLNDAAKSVVAWKNESDVSGGVTQDMSYIARYDDLVEEFKNFKKDQEDFNKQLLTQLDKQNEYINKRLDHRDRVLMETLDKTLNSSKELSEPDNKKWWQIFKK